MYRCSSFQKVCVTCEHWCGRRNILPNLAEVETDSQERGRCRVNEIRSLETSATNYCDDYEKSGSFRY